ncbi:DRIM domain containing protein [Sarcoptes scabiei]|uniref:DRIM domain containing protein n=1 Tax=Sarcoptes scabiei TaxID=52283 RepID=A0A132A7R1_SARSC|nr:DRIM domain containing protein [Sarcoptes scabiei]
MLTQIIHRKHFLANILIEELTNIANKAIDTVLELIIALIKDLQSELYEYFGKIFEKLVDLSMKVTDIKTLENIFFCQTILFKYMWKNIVDEIELHFPRFQLAFTSSKSYVVNFTSETFAFLIRKSKSPEKIFKLLSETVRNDSKMINATGLIIYETIKGVQGGLIDKANQFLKYLLEICVENIDNGHWFESIGRFLESCLDSLAVKHFGVIINFFLDEYPNDGLIVITKIRFLHQIAMHKNCYFIEDIEKFFKQSTRLYFETKSIEQDEKSRLDLLEIFESILNFKNDSLENDWVNDFCSKFYVYDPSKNSLKDLFKMTSNVLCSRLFRTIISKHLNNVFISVLSSNSNFDDYLAIEFLSLVINKQHPRPDCGAELLNLHRYPIEHNQAVIEKLFSIIHQTDEPHLIYHCLVILSSFIDKNVEIFVQNHIFKPLLTNLHENLNSCEEKIDAIIFKEFVIFCILQHQSSNSLFNQLDIDDFVNVLSANPSSLEILQAFDIFASFKKSITTNFIDTLKDRLGKFYPILEQNLSYPNRMNRIVSLHSINLMQFSKPSINDCDSTIFNICYQAETIPIGLENYRERLRWIWKLDCKYVQNYIPQSINGVVFNNAPIYFLLGNLYENLNVLWKPITEVLATYDTHLDDTFSFGDILLKHFRYNQLRILGENQNPTKVTLRKYLEIESDTSDQNEKNKPDFSNHRIWLLKSFQLFPKIIERKNREFIDLFFEFLNREFNSNHINLSNKRENICVDTNESNCCDDADAGRKTIHLEPISNEKVIWKTFFSFLEVLEKFKNPKALHKEKELFAMYLNLLSSPNSIAQHHSFNCLLTYQYPFLVRYRDNFHRLIDNKSFKSEIHSFRKFDNENDNVIAVEDQPEVTPFFLRILIGKMMASAGTKTHGKHKVDYFRSLIFKLLANFDQSEQLMLMELIYQTLQPLFQYDYYDLLDKIVEFVDPKSFIHFKHFQSFITTLEFLMKNFGNNHQEVMRLIYKILIIVASICSILLQKSSRFQLKTFIIDKLKTIRTHCFKVACYFFQNFPSYPLTTSEIDVFFETLIKPLMPSLHLESLNFPSPLMRLFKIWTENNNYFRLLRKSFDYDGIEQKRCAIDSIIKIYSDQRASKVTISFINVMIENLLESDDSRSVEDLSVAEKSGEIDAVDVPGSSLLMPYLSKIIQRIQYNYTAKSMNCKSNYTLQEINILARLSVHVKDVNDSQSIIKLLMRSLSNQKKKFDEDKEIFIFKILCRLSKNLQPSNFFELLDLINNLFIIIDRPVPRRELCKILMSLSLLNCEFKPMANFIIDLNAYNPRFPEEPDYDLRIETFKKIFAHIDQYQNTTDFTQLQLQFFKLLCLNCAFFIRNHDDLGLKEFSSNTIVNVCRLFQDGTEKIFNEFVVELIFCRIISKGLGDSRESACNEFITILAKLIRMFPSKNKLIDQLSILCNDEDEEIDFWNNIKHIQLHRRARALNRLLQNQFLFDSLSTGRVFSKFLIPIVERFVLKSKEYSHLGLLKASIEAFAKFIQYCCWSKFDLTLTYYIKQLFEEKIDAKIAIQIISSLLENFTFLHSDDVRMVESTLDENDLQKLALVYNLDSAMNHRKSSQSIQKLNRKARAKSIQKSKETTNLEPSEEQMQIDEKSIQPAKIFDKDLMEKRKIYESFCGKLLPLLHRCLHHKLEQDDYHDLNKINLEDDEDKSILTIQLCLPVVKLLQSIHIDRRVFDCNLNSIVLRLCQFLQSKSFKIRQSARKILVKIIEIIGPKYFRPIFFELKVLLSRGFQRHVSIFTVNSLLQKLIPQLSGGDLDDCYKDLIELCQAELFGQLSEEKEISKIVTKTVEAKSTRSYEIYQTMAQFASENSLPIIIESIKTSLHEAHDYQTLKKIEKILNSISIGLIKKRDCNLTKEQIEVLLQNAENHVEEFMQPSMSNECGGGGVGPTVPNMAIYGLLKAIIIRKLKFKELHILMEKLFILILTTEIDGLRSQATELYIKYLLEYPIEPNRFKGKLLDLVKRAGYDHIVGRKAVLLILKSVIANLSTDLLLSLKEKLFGELSTCLACETIDECLKLLNEIIAKLLMKFTQQDRDDLFTRFVLHWMSSSNRFELLGCRSMNIFIECERKNFESKIPKCLELIASKFDVERFQILLERNLDNVREDYDGRVINENLTKTNQKQWKHNLLCCYLNFVRKFLIIFDQERIISLIKHQNSKENFSRILRSITIIVGYQSNSICDLCLEIFEKYFLLFDPSEFVSNRHQNNPFIESNRNETKSTECMFLFDDTRNELCDLVLKFCLVLRDLHHSSINSDRLIKILIYIAQIFIRFDSDDSEMSQNNENGMDTINKSKSVRPSKNYLLWLIKKLLKEINFEIKLKPDRVEKRIFFIKWIAAVSLKLGHDRIQAYLPYFLPILCREDISASISSNSSMINHRSSISKMASSDHDDLKNLAKQVLQMIRSMMDSDKFIDFYNQIRNEIFHRRLARRKQRAQQVCVLFVFPLSF